MLVLAAVAIAAPAPAQDRTENIHLDYAASAGCPTAEGFESLVRARTARAHFEVAGGATRVFDVKLAAGKPASGRVTVRRGASSEGTREVRADSCADVADALALVVALAVDPAALTSPVSEPAATPASVTSAAPPASSGPAPSQAPAQPSPPPAPAPTASAPQPAAPASVTPPSSIRRSEASSPAVAASPRTLSLGVDLDVSAGTAPGALVGPSPWVAWVSPAHATIVPAVRLALARASTGSIAVTGGSADFVWTVGRADGCAVLGPSRSTRLSGCLRLEAGAVDADGVNIPDAKRQTRGWFAVGPLVQAQWSFASPLFLELEAAAMVHVVADRFYFLPDVTAYQVPGLGLVGSAGLGVYFL